MQAVAPALALEDITVTFIAEGSARYTAIRDEELATLHSALPDYPWTDAASLLDDLVLSDEFAEFLTLSAYPRLG